MFRILCLVLIALLAGCTSRQLYDSAQATRQAECRLFTDPIQWQNCMDAANRSYDSYRMEMPKKEAP
jgi:hypothetical protein